MIGKKNLVVICMVIFLIHFSYAVDENYYRKIEETARVHCEMPGHHTLEHADGIETNYIFFEGFDFYNYIPSKDGCQKMNEDAYIAAKHFMGDEPFVLIGYSQGGMRALAFSTYVKEHDPKMYKQIAGIITLAGINRGLKMFEGYGSTLRVKSKSYSTIIFNGIRRFFSWNIIPGAATTLTQEFFRDDVYDSILIAIAKSVITGSNSPGAIDRVAYPLFKNENWNDYAQIRDMCPQSEFIKQYIVEEKSNTYKVQNGGAYRINIEWRRKWIFFYPVFIKQWVPHYDIYHNMIENIKVDKNMPMTFIEGVKADTFQALVDQKSENAKDIEKVKTTISGFGTAFRVAEGYYIAKCVLGVGLLDGSAKYAHDCKRAAEVCENPQSMLNDLVGSSDNDGLAARESQYLPKESGIWQQSGSIQVLNDSTESKVNYTHGNVHIKSWAEAMRIKNEYIARMK